MHRRDLTPQYVVGEGGSESGDLGDQNLDTLYMTIGSRTEPTQLFAHPSKQPRNGGRGGLILIHCLEIFL
jgi:hypothetical protein